MGCGFFRKTKVSIQKRTLCGSVRRTEGAMASAASYFEDLTCSVCLIIFTDPVTLSCGHSFCRECITLSLKTQHQCPQCRAAVSTEETSLPTNHILKSLAEKAKEAERLKKEGGTDKMVTEWMCPEHEEKLKLFCVTDQQLACIICRDGERHEGHKFKPIREAAAAFRKELDTFMKKVTDDICATERQANTQREEIRKTKVKSEQLMTHISRQFEEMHQFLRKREDEIKKELKDKEKDGVERMSESLNTTEEALTESRELEGKVAEVLKITDSERFLKSWTDDEILKTMKSSFQPRIGNLQVVNSSLSLGPYESHLQFFVWKEMLQVIQPRAELLSLTSNSPDLTVSDGHSLFSVYQQPSIQRNAFPWRSASSSCHCRVSQLCNTGQHSCAVSTDVFTSGQHYWEVDVGKRSYWELGIQNCFLKYDGNTYTVSRKSASTALTFTDRPRKIGIYLNCSSKELSFYDADNMKHIHTVSDGVMQVSAHFGVKHNVQDSPLTVCVY